MRVKELIERLKSFDGEFEVLCYCDDDSIRGSNCGFRLFEIERVDCHNAETMKLDDGTPYLKFESTQFAQKHVLLNVVAEF